MAQDEDDEDTLSLWMRIKSRINQFTINAARLFAPVIKPIKALYNGVMDFANAVMDTKLFKFVTGSALGRFVAAASLIAAASTTAVPVTVLGLTSIAVGIAIDTVQTYNLRRVKKERSLLIKNRNAKEVQNRLLKNNPQIAAALAEDLYVVDNSKEGLRNKKYAKTAARTFSFTSWGKAMLKNAFTAIRASVNVAISPVKSTIALLVLAIKGIYSEGVEQHTKKNISREFKLEINNELDKNDTPIYKDLTELAQKTRIQRIQAIAIHKLVENQERGMYDGFTPEQIREAFKQEKEKLEVKIAKVNSRRGVINKSRIVATSFVKAHNPFSKYTDFKKLQEHKRQYNKTAQATHDKFMQGKEPDGISQKTKLKAKEIGEHIADNTDNVAGKQPLTKFRKKQESRSF